MTWHPPEELITRNKNPERGPAERKDRKTATGKSRILHVDMDAFFASIEQRDNPHLKGKPVIVGGPAGGRGVAATCSYEARQYGVRSGMALAEAERRCPHGIFLKTNGKKYTKTAIKIVEIFHRYTPVVEPVSIDEAYLDITGTLKNYTCEVQLARILKQDIENILALTCSVGIARNRIFAKLASEMNKPDGLTILTDDRIKKTVHPLPVEKLWGIGEKTSAVMHTLGITTIGELTRCPDNVLKKHFGSNGPHLKQVARGESSASVIPIDKRPEEKSIGHEHTFAHDIRDPDISPRMLLKLSQKVGRRMRKKGFAGKTVTLKLRYSNFETHTHRETFPDFIRDDLKIYEAGKMLFDHLYQKHRAVRLLGISMSKLMPLTASENGFPHQSDLFQMPSGMNGILPMMDLLRDEFGEGIISRCGAII